MNNKVLDFLTRLKDTIVSWVAQDEEEEDVFHGFSYYFAHFPNKGEFQEVEESLKPYRLIEGYFKEDITNVYLYCPLTISAYKDTFDKGQEIELDLEEIKSQIRVEIERALSKFNLIIVANEKENGLYEFSTNRVDTLEGDDQNNPSYNFNLVRKEWGTYLTCEGKKQFQADSPQELKTILLQALDWVNNLRDLESEDSVQPIN